MNHSLHVHEYYMYLKKVDCQKLLRHCFTYGNEFSYINFVDSRDFLRLGLFRLMVSSWDEPITILRRCSTLVFAIGIYFPMQNTVSDVC